MLAYLAASVNLFLSGLLSSYLLSIFFALLLALMEAGQEFFAGILVERNLLNIGS